MLIYALKRLATGVSVLLVVAALTYWLLLLAGGLAIARSALGPSAHSPEVATWAEKMGLMRPWPIQYLEWLRYAVAGDLGKSYVTQQPVDSVLASSIPVTLSIVVASMVLTLVVSVILGVSAATRGGLVDRGVQIFAVAAQALPSYWIALVLVIVVSLQLSLLPATGFIPFSTSPLGWLSTILLPAVAIAFGNIAAVSQQLRGSMVDVLQQDYIRTLRSRGVSPRAIVYRHALRNAAVAALTVFSLQVIGTLSCAVVIERVFALPGLGQVAIRSGLQGDIPVVLGVVIFMVAVVVVVNLSIDITNALLNPKSRRR